MFALAAVALLYTSNLFFGLFTFCACCGVGDRSCEVSEPDFCSLKVIDLIEQK